MNLEQVEKIANAVLYEGYILYPYRPSAMKNQQRWNFGALYPQSYGLASLGTDAWTMQTECLVEGSQHTSLDVRVRFLHLLARDVCEVTNSNLGAEAHSLARELTKESGQGNELPHLLDANLRVVASLEVGDQVFHTWQEAVERDVSLPNLKLDELAAHPQRHAFSFPSNRETEILREHNDQVVGVIVRKQERIEGAVEMRIADCGLKGRKSHLSIHPRGCSRSRCVF